MVVQTSQIPDFWYAKQIATDDECLKSAVDIFHGLLIHDLLTATTVGRAYPIIT
jgi:hypothetical protein